MDRDGLRLIGQRVDGHAVCDHESGVKAQAEMTDDLVIIGLVLILLQEILRAGKGDLVDVLVHLVLSHAETIVCEADAFLVGADLYLDRILFSLRLAEIADQGQLLQLRDRVAAVGHHFTHENIVIGIKPLFYNRKDIVAVDRKIAAFCRHIKSPLVFLSLKVIIVQIEQKSTKN